MSWQTVLGFEVHVELATKSKMFCGCPADHFSAPANAQTCPVCLGLPGALPVPNAKAIEWCIKMGLSLHCKIKLHSKFDRKNYFYPDLAKAYQISQYDQPFCYDGYLDLPSNGKRIRITRVHMEEDTGKLQHAGGQTLIDFNRSGVPLVEIVTEPDFDNTDDSTEFLKEVQLIIRKLGISTADMEKGSMRLEANISVRSSDSSDLPNYKVEVKNVNSFRFIKKAIEYEVTRQTELLEKGEIPAQETRGFNEDKGETVSQRRKENAHDYRYFPEPDIPPIEFTQAQIDTWAAELPELPAATRSRLETMGISPQNAVTLVANPARLIKFKELVGVQCIEPIKYANLVLNAPEDKLDSVGAIHELPKLTDDATIRPVAEAVLAANPKAIADIKAGKTQVLFFLVGQIKKQLGDVDIPTTQNILNQLISQ